MKPWLLLLLCAAVAPAQDPLQSIQSYLAHTPNVERGSLDSSARLLDQERSRLDARDFARAYLLADLYQRIGAAYARDGYYPGALRNYHGALLVLNRIAAANPDDPRVRGDLLAVVGSVQALGRTVPVWANIPVGGAGVSEVAPEPVAPRDEVPEFALPNLEIALLPDAQKRACEDALNRYLQTAAAAQGALSVLADLRVSVESRGLTLRADYVAAESRIKLRISGCRFPSTPPSGDSPSILRA